MSKIKFIDLFCGIGGFRLALQKIGWQCVYSADNNQHACQMYQANYGVNPYQDITKLTDNDIKNIPNFDVLCAGFPCQPFSISGKKKGFLDKTRGTLFFQILRFLKIKHPKAFILENVKFLIYHNHGKTFQVIKHCLRQCGYHIDYHVLNAEDFGVPQNRQRIIIVGNRLHKRFDFKQLKLQPVQSMKPFLQKTGHFTVLPKNKYTLLPKKYLKRQKSNLIFCGFVNGSLRKRGVKKNSLWLSRSHRMPSRIYSANGVNPTISSQETDGRYWIYINGLVRKLTLNEVYRFMGFPKSFKKVGSKSKLYNRIGNAVCVPMIFAVGNVLNQILRK